MKHKILFLFTLCLSQFAQGQVLFPKLDKTTQNYGYKEKGQIEWSLPPVYKAAGYFIGRLAIVKEGEFEYAIDLHGKKVSPDFKKMQPFYVDRDLLLCVCQDVNGMYNIYDTRFNPICKTSYQNMFVYKYHVLSFESEGLYGLMDMMGNILIPPMYRSLDMDNYYSFTKADKDGIDREAFDGAFVEAQNTDGMYGLVTLNNEIIVPFQYSSSYDLKSKGLKKAYKNAIKPYLLSSKKQELDALVEEARMSSLNTNKELAEVYPTDLPVVEKTVVKQIKNGYAFFKADRQVGKTYQNIDRYDKCCIVNQNGKYGVTDLLGAETIKCAYDNVSIWNVGLGDDVLLLESQGKYSLCGADGTILSTKDCDMIFQPSNNAGVAIKDGKYWLVNSKGYLVSQYGYENIDNYSADNKIYAERFGYKTELTADGKEVSPIVRQIFDEAYKLPLADHAQEKYNKYLLCISLDPKNREGIRALSLNNIGAMFEDLGDVDKAMEYYEQARNMGDETARKNIRRIRLDRTMTALQQVGEALTQAMTIDTSGANSALQQDYSSDAYYNNYDMSAGEGTGGRSYEFWKQQYDRWERNARSCYESLTNTGYRTQRNGKDTGGSAAGSWGGGSFSGMKMNLRKAQREMRDIRTKARRDGHNIPQSNYETIDVSY